MRKIIEKYLKVEERYKLITDAIGDGELTAREIMSRTKLLRDTTYYYLAYLVKNHYLIVTPKRTKKGKGLHNHYSLSAIPFVPRTVEELEAKYPVGYFAETPQGKAWAAKYGSEEVKGPYDDMIAANPSLRKIEAKWETNPELFKTKHKPENRGIPSMFGMYYLA